LPPLETIKLAGIDLSNKETWVKAGEIIGNYIKRLKEISKDIKF
jgi:oligoendopeptidase F